MCRALANCSKRIWLQVLASQSAPLAFLEKILPICYRLIEVANMARWSRLAVPAALVAVGLCLLAERTPVPSDDMLAAATVSAAPDDASSLVAPPVPVLLPASSALAVSNKRISVPVRPAPRGKARSPEARAQSPPAAL